MLIGTGVYLSGWSSESWVDPCRKGGKMRKEGKEGRRKMSNSKSGMRIAFRGKRICKFEASLGYDTKSPPPPSINK